MEEDRKISTILVFWLSNLVPSEHKQTLKARLHVSSPFPSPSTSKFIIVPMERNELFDRQNGYRTHSIHQTSPSPFTQCKLDGDKDQDADWDGTCKQALNSNTSTTLFRARNLSWRQWRHSKLRHIFQLIKHCANCSSTRAGNQSHYNVKTKSNQTVPSWK